MSLLSGNVSYFKIIVLHRDLAWMLVQRSHRRNIFFVFWEYKSLTGPSTCIVYIVRALRGQHRCVVLMVRSSVCVQLLVESGKLLRRLITDHRLKSQPENDTVTSEWLTARCDALCLKIKWVTFCLLLKLKVINLFWKYYYRVYGMEMVHYHCCGEILHVLSNPNALTAINRDIQAVKLCCNKILWLFVWLLLANIGWSV